MGRRLESIDHDYHDYPDGPVRAPPRPRRGRATPGRSTPRPHALRKESNFEDESAHYPDDCPLLVLGDLGREKVTDNVADRLYVLVESRCGQQPPTVVMASLTPTTLRPTTTARSYPACPDRKSVV